MNYTEPKKSIYTMKTENVDFQNLPKEVQHNILELGMNVAKQLNILPNNTPHQQEFNLESLSSNSTKSNNKSNYDKWREGDTKVVKEGQFMTQLTSVSKRTATLEATDRTEGRPENCFSQSEISNFLNCSPSVVVRLAKQNGWRSISWIGHPNLPNRVWYMVTENYVQSCFNGSELGVSTVQVIDMLELGQKSSSHTLIAKLGKFSNWEKNKNSKHSFWHITEEQAKKDFYTYSTEIGSVNVLTNRILISHRPKNCYYKTEISNHIRKHSKYGKALKKDISLRVILAIAKESNWEFQEVSKNSKYNYHFKINLHQARLDYDTFKINSFKKRGHTMNKAGLEESRLTEVGFVRLSCIRDEFLPCLNLKTQSSARTFILSLASFSKWETVNVPFSGGQGFVSLYKVTKSQALDDLKAFKAQQYIVPVTISGNHENVFSKDYKWFNENDGKLMENYILEEFDGYMCTFSHEGQSGIKVPCNFFSEKNQLDLSSDNS